MSYTNFLNYFWNGLIQKLLNECLCHVQKRLVKIFLKNFLKNPVSSLQNVLADQNLD